MDVRTTEPFGNSDFRRIAERDSARTFAAFLSARAAGGFVALDGVWHHLPGGRVVETEKSDPATSPWHDLIVMTFGDDGEDRLETVRFIKPA